jgi:CRISPR type I-F-associated protein Csy2
MNPESFYYLLIDDLTVSGFNAMSNPYIVGAPGPTALVGWSHALERMLRGKQGKAPESPLPIRVDGASLIVKSCDFDQGRPLFPAQLNTGKDRKDAEKGNTPPMVEEIKGNGRFALAVAFHLPQGTPREEAEDCFDELESDPGLVRDWLSCSRLAGGSVHDIGNITAYEDFDKGRASFLPRFSRLQGTSLIDRSDLLQPEDELGNLDHLDRLLDAIAIQQRRFQDRRDSQRRQPGWIVPYASGYKAIEIPKERRASLNGHPHAYVEPMLGLGEYVPVTRLAADRERLLSAFWHPVYGNGSYAARPLLQQERYGETTQ